MKLRRAARSPSDGSGHSCFLISTSISATLGIWEEIGSGAGLAVPNNEPGRVRERGTRQMRSVPLGGSRMNALSRKSRPKSKSILVRPAAALRNPPPAPAASFATNGKSFPGECRSLGDISNFACLRLCGLPQVNAAFFLRGFAQQPMRSLRTEMPSSGSLGDCTRPLRPELCSDRGREGRKEP